MVKTTVYLDDEVVLLLKQIAATAGQRQAEIIRHALAEYVRKAAARPQPRGIGAYRSGRSDVSQRAEILLRKAARRR